MRRGTTAARALRGRLHRGGRAGRRLALLAPIFAIGVLGVFASSSAAVSQRDAAATRSSLQANIAWAEAQLANAAQSTAAVQATVTQISHECPGVLAGAPGEPERTAGRHIIRSLRESQAQLSARAMGEHTRQARQLQVLQFELALAVSQAAMQPDRAATVALIAALSPLRWSDPLVALLVHLTVETVQEELDAPAPAVCADMSAWVSSGYKTLSPASKALEARSNTIFERTFEILALASDAQTTQPLAQTPVEDENASDRALDRRNKALSAQLQSQQKAQEEARTHLEVTVGLPAAEPKKVTAAPKKKPVVIAHGRTAAGGSFVARAEPIKRKALLGEHCTVEISIAEPSRPSGRLFGGGLFELLSGNSPERCLSRNSHVDPEQTVHCNTGLLTVEASLPASVTSVRLLLSDNHTITSNAIRVPRRLGGPAGLYYQVLRGPSPIPVSLTELDANGNTLAVLKLPAVVECRKKLVKYFPGGRVELAHGSLPAGPSFTIGAERYRELGQVHFKLKFTASNEESPEGSGGGGSLESSGAAEAEGVSIAFPGHPLQAPQPFQRESASGCLPQPYAIVYGILHAPGDTVLARVSGELVPLKKVTIPARLHAGGVLAYGAFSPIPTELITRDGSGKTVAVDNNFGIAARTTIETCEGEAE